MNSEDIESPEWHGRFLREREEAIKNGTDRFIDWEEAKQIILKETKALEAIKAGLSDIKAGRTTKSDEFFDEFLSRNNISDTE
jgi:predicted transcriptional regulator